MCFEPSARPPRAPRSGSLRSSERLTIRARDGATFVARLALTKRCLSAWGRDPDRRAGLHPYYELLADEVAGAGAHAVAADPYGRTAGVEYRDAAFDYEPHAPATTAAGFAADVQAAVAKLTDSGAASSFVLGFCQGGRAAFMQAAQPGIRGVVGFYGSPVSAEPGGRPPVEEARKGLVRAHVLGLFGGADERITRDDVAAYDAALVSSGVPHELVVYDDAPHSFFDRAMDHHMETCADAWARVLRFIGVPA